MMNLWKPWYVRRPRQLLRRLTQAVTGTPAGPALVTTPWGMELAVDPRETIGRALWTTGIYDLAVSEAVFRLARPGGLHLDIGANIGYVTNLLAFRAGPTGRVLSFEPHPVVGGRLAENVARIRASGTAAPVEVFPFALSDQEGEARLVEPPGFGANAGIAKLAASGETGGQVVLTKRLDDILGDRTAAVVKIDVEGFEAAVLRGASRAVAEKRLCNIVFEEHGGSDAESVRLLLRAGYSVFKLGWRMSGPVLADLAAPAVCKPYEAPNYLATVEASARAACERRGWHVLSGRGPQRSSE